MQHLIAEVPRKRGQAELTVGIDLGDVWSHYSTLHACPRSGDGTRANLPLDTRCGRSGSVSGVLLPGRRWPRWPRTSESRKADWLQDKRDGSELAALDHFVVVVKGDTLDHGGTLEGVEARVASLLPFLVLKSFAIEERDKNKDSYDIVWILNAFAGGSEAAVAAMAKSPVIGRAEVKEAIQYLHKNFQSIDHRDPAQYARFEASEGTDEERIALRRYAHGTLQEFFRHWNTLGIK